MQYLFLDESGNLHKNSPDRFFVIGGIFTNNYDDIKKSYVEINRELKEKLNIPQVSTGDIFRKNMKEGTKLGKLAESYISKGKLVPDDVTIEKIKNKILHGSLTSHGYIALTVSLSRLRLSKTVSFFVVNLMLSPLPLCVSSLATPGSLALFLFRGDRL